MSNLPKQLFEKCGNDCNTYYPIKSDGNLVCWNQCIQDFGPIRIQSSPVDIESLNYSSDVEVMDAILSKPQNTMDYKKCGMGKMLLLPSVKLQAPINSLYSDKLWISGINK
jgi:hypothetical protein